MGGLGMPFGFGHSYMGKSIPYNLSGIFIQAVHLKLMYGFIIHHVNITIQAHFQVILP